VLVDHTNNRSSGSARRRILDSGLTLGNWKNVIEDWLDHDLRDQVAIRANSTPNGFMKMKR
jgi:hypothetical protein